MDKFERAKIIAKVVWGSIMIALGIFLWLVGLAGFNQIEDVKLVAWFVWGVITTPFIIPFVIDMVKDQAKQGKQWIF